jgi:hypothetical protein
MEGARRTDVRYDRQSNGGSSARTISMAACGRLRRRLDLHTRLDRPRLRK